jgi:hypothetical protein
MKHCDYCHSSIVEGQRWVRQKIYNPYPDSQDATYQHYHAEPFAADGESCWEKLLVERETALRSAPPRLGTTNQFVSING